MKFYKQNNYDNGNLVNTDSIEIKRNKYNMPVLLCYTHYDEYFEATVRSDGHVFISKCVDTIFEKENEIFANNENAVPLYTIKANEDLAAWAKNNPIPDVSDEPLLISKILYIEDHPALGKLAIQCLVNDFDEVSFAIDPDTMEVVAENLIDQIPEMIIQDAIKNGGDEIIRDLMIDKEISLKLNEIAKIHPYHPADNMLSYKMAYEVQYLNYDYSQMRRYDIPVSVEGEAGRLVINRKDSFWEACLYIHDRKWAKMEQNETPKNGGFAHMNDDEFLFRVCTVYGFMKDIIIDIEQPPLAA